MGEKDRISLSFTASHADPQSLQEACRSQSGVEQVSLDDGQLTMLAEDGAQALPGLFEALKKLDVHVQAVEIEEPNLETVFLHLTGRALRD